jgi:N-acetylmuramoyl-L-alanine amidase
MSKKLIVVDPGHGGDDNGAAWGHAEEDDINLIVAFLLEYELRLAGFSVLLTRERDKNVSLRERVDLANRKMADLFVSIHCDAWHNTTASGISAHVFRGGSISSSVADSVLETLMARFPDHANRGVKKSNFYVLRETIMPAVLVECEFLSNPETRRFLREPENQRALARAIAAGIMADQRMHWWR